MAGIDKLYLHSYSELLELKQWALAYYPKLFIYFYDWAFNATRKDFDDAILKKAKETENAFKADWERISPDGTINCAVAYIMREWGWEDENDARREAEEINSNARKSLDEIKRDMSLPIMNTPLSVDKKLKWICPLVSIRLYLQTQCGVRERSIYRLFWRGTREFE